MTSLAEFGQRIVRAAARMPVGARRRCNLCGRSVRSFLPYRGGWEAAPPMMRSLGVVGSDLDNFECPACGCHDRERHLVMYMEAAGLAKAMAGARILHMAPECHLQDYIRAAHPAEYVQGDLQPDRAGVQKLDLQALAFADDSFDLVIANHVLEHVQDDRKALAEIRRVLRPGGRAILQTPFSQVLTRSFEDAAIQTPEACLHAFGQEDHRRLYGRDIARHFESCGLVSRIQSHASLLAHIDPVVHGVNGNEPFFLFEKERARSGVAPAAESCPRNALPTQDAAAGAPLASVLCITYNHERFIAQALKSMLTQEVPFPYEIVVGDDCSTDGTVAVIEAYQRRFPGRIRLLTSPVNAGANRNFRRTMKACRGRYIAICEGDDFWNDPRKLAKQVDFLERHPDYVIAYHDAYVMDESGRREQLQLPSELQRDASAEELARTRPISTLTTCFRNVLEDIPPEFNNAPVLDLCLWSLLSRFGAGKYMGSIAPAVYRVHGGGMFSTQSQRDRLRLTARTYLCLAEYHESRGDQDLGGYFAFQAVSIIGEQLRGRQQLKLIRGLAGGLWRKVQARWRSGRAAPSETR